MDKKQKHLGLSNKDFKTLSKYLGYLADNMGLRDWTLIISHEEPDSKDAWASVKPVYGRRSATFFFSKDFRDVPLENQRAACVHELLHCHLDNIDSLVVNEFRTALGEVFWNGWYPGFKLVLEHGIDAVAEAWAEKFPLIRW